MPRLYLPSPFFAGAVIETSQKQAHYLAQVMRLEAGDHVTLFNGRDGEWEGQITILAKRHAQIELKMQERQQTEGADIWLVAALLRNSKTEYVVEKATELGAARIIPVTTRFTVATKINRERLEAIALEAAEQCERLDLPVITDYIRLENLLGDWDKDRILIYADESGKGQNARMLLPTLNGGKYAVLVGPEGGFAPLEHAILSTLPFARGMCMGSRILRADTAAVAALTLVQSFLGDWEIKPDFRR